MATNKISLLQQKLKNNQYLFIYDNSNIFYLTGIKNIGSDNIYLLVSKERFFILSSSLSYTQIKNVFNYDNVVMLKNLKLDLMRLLPKRYTLEVDTKNIPYRVYDILLKIKKDTKFTDLISNLRQIKTQDEIKNIKKACRIIKKVIKDTKKKLYPGITEIELKNFVLEKMLKYNVEPSFEPIVAFDENTSYPHHVSNTKKFTKQSLVLLDVGCKYNGYCCDVTRMLNVFNTKNKDIIDLYTKLTNLQKKLISLCKPNVKVKEIDDYAKKFFTKLGYAENYLHSVGHGLGIDIHEPPRLSVKDDTVLQSGMVVTIEPGVYFENKFGLRIEDDIVITDKGCEVIT